MELTLSEHLAMARAVRDKKMAAAGVDRTAHFSKLAASKWAGVSPAERSEYMRWIRSGGKKKPASPSHRTSRRTKTQGTVTI